MEHIVQSEKFKYSMILCLLSYAIFKISYRPLNDIFQTLFILGFIISAFYDREFLKKDPLVKLFGVAVLIHIAAWFHGTYFTPYTPKLSSRGLIDLFLFLPIAYCLKGNPKYILWALLSFCLGGILVVFTNNGANTLHLFESGMLHGDRINLLFNNSNHPGVLGGILLLISIMLFTIFFQLAKKVRTKPHCLLAIMVTLLTFLISICYIYISQARTTYLALFITLLLTPIIYHLLQLNIKKLIYRALPLTFSLLIVFICIINVPSIHNRLTHNQQAWQQIFKGDIENIDTSSIGLRIIFWLGAKDQIQKNPVLGLGDTKAAGYTQDHSKYLSTIEEKEKFRFIHNGHIEILLAFGISGLLTLWSIYFLIIRLTYNAPPQYQWLLTSGAISLTLYLFVSNCFESYYIYKQGIFIHNLLLGCIYSIPMFTRFKEPPLKSAEIST